MNRSPERILKKTPSLGLPELARLTPQEVIRTVDRVAARRPSRLSSAHQDLLQAILHEHRVMGGIPSHAELREKTGLDSNQVQWGMRVLRRKGLLPDFIDRTRGQDIRSADLSHPWVVAHTPRAERFVERYLRRHSESASHWPLLRRVVLHALVNSVRKYDERLPHSFPRYSGQKMREALDNLAQRLRKRRDSGAYGRPPRRHLELVRAVLALHRGGYLNETKAWVALLSEVAGFSPQRMNAWFPQLGQAASVTIGTAPGRLWPSI